MSMDLPEFLALVDEARTRIQELTPEKAQVLIDAGAVVIDVRDRNAW